VDKHFAFYGLKDVLAVSQKKEFIYFAPMLKTTGARLKLILKGAAMGIAEVIPGVSGGTIAFITGIYERLIDAIKAIDVEFIGHLLKFKIVRAWAHIDGVFIGFLLLGMAVGIGVGVFGVSHLMDNYPEELWGFFFGLIMASALYIARRVSDWKISNYAFLILGATVAFAITIINPSSGNTNLFYIFISGVIAISALILPGISGSFILLLMGVYTVIMPTIKHFLSTLDPADLALISIFALGCLTGLVTFSRVLSWLFHNHRDATLATLTGVMLGSLNKIWPWRNPIKWMDDEGNIFENVTSDYDDLRVIVEQKVLPAQYTWADPNTIVVIFCAVVGFMTVFLLDRTLSSEEKTD
jgi:putative membrane protein